MWPVGDTSVFSPIISFSAALTKFAFKHRIPAHCGTVFALSSSGLPWANFAWVEGAPNELPPPDALLAPDEPAGEPLDAVAPVEPPEYAGYADTVPGTFPLGVAEVPGELSPSEEPSVDTAGESLEASGAPLEAAGDALAEADAPLSSEAVGAEESVELSLLDPAPALESADEAGTLTFPAATPESEPPELPEAEPDPDPEPESEPESAPEAGLALTLTLLEASEPPGWALTSPFDEGAVAWPGIGGLIGWLPAGAG